MKRKRIHWRDFIGSQAWREMQSTLRKRGFHLAVKLDADKIARDVFIVEIHPSASV